MQGRPAKYQGKYISHMRSEGNRLVEAVDELLRIAREAKIPAEIYHLKAAGERNWPKMDKVIAMVERRASEGLKITADMYTSTAGATGLDAAMPPWALDGGYEALYKRLRDPDGAKKIAEAIRTPTDAWENLYLAAGSPERVLLVEFKNESAAQPDGKDAGAVRLGSGRRIRSRRSSNLVLEDQSRVGTVYFMMSEDNIKKQIRQPWVSFGSDGRLDGDRRAVPRVVRILARTATSRGCSASTSATRRSSRSRRRSGVCRACRRRISDSIVAGCCSPAISRTSSMFDPGTIADRATFEKPHRYSVGMKHVLVNGQMVLKDGEHTGAKPGRALKGPGATRVP